MIGYVPYGSPRVGVQLVVLWPPSGRFCACDWARSILEMIERDTG